MPPTTPSNVPALISAVVATRDAAVVTPAALTCSLSVPSLCSTVIKLAVCEPTPVTVKVISPVVSPAIAKPALTDNKSFTVTVVNVPAAGVSLPITFPSISPALLYTVNGAASVPN